MLTPALIAAARADINRHFARNLRIAARRAVRRVRFALARIAEARRHRREIEFLLHADDRMLADIGLTRAEAHFAFGNGSGAAAWDAASRRDESRKASTGGIEKLPQVKSPALAPVLQKHIVTHENFR